MNKPAEICEKDVDPQLIAGFRMRGRYEEVGKGFKKLGRKFGRYMAGPCFTLYYDDEYKPTDADYEACMPVKKSREAEGISVREFPGGRCLSLLHHGPYQELKQTYTQLFEYANEQGYSVQLPLREVYLKGPGMFFKGNPQKYVTELQFFFEECGQNQQCDQKES